ncbi:MAG: Flp pilus assembly protein TadG [Paracoccaceae bacterium]|jgi:Flp pilus assembly protein TadG
MIGIVRPLRRALRRFLKVERGTATIEFVLVFPPLMLLFISAFEAGLMQVRHTMLDQGLDKSVRTLRLGTNAPLAYADLKQAICDGAGLIPNCMDNLKLEMVRIDPQTTMNVTVHADCVDRAEPLAPVREYAVGDENDLMLLRACVLFDPMFPTTGLGFQMPKKSGDAYALVSMSSYVSEPN